MALQSTHAVRMGGSMVFKRYRPPVQGEDEREFGALTVLAKHAPGLAPRPIRLEKRDGRSELTMSRFGGRALGDRALTPTELRGLARAMGRLHQPVPDGALDSWPLRRGTPAELMGDLQVGLAESHRGVSPLVTEAAYAARRWLETAGEATASGFPRRRVFTNADGNLSNYLWDGVECHIVDYEDAGISGWAYEVADLLEHPTVALTGAFQAEALLELMEADAQDLADLHQYRCLLACFWFALLLPGGPATHRNPPGSLDKQARRVLHLRQP